MTDLPKFVRYHDDDFAALYKDGILVVSGDRDHTDHYLASFLEVKELFDDESFFLGKDKADGEVAATLKEIDSYVDSLDEDEGNTEAIAKYEQVETLRAEAKRLIDKAIVIEVEAEKLLYGYES